MILDRDGVINKDFGFVSDIDKFKWVDGSLNLIKYLNKKQNIFVVTNQSGIARGYFSEKKLSYISILKFSSKKLLYKSIYYCPYHPAAKIKKYRKNKNLRKPKNGMFLKIMKDWNINKKNTIMIGDQISDIEFARNSKIKGYLFNEKNLFSFGRKIL